MNKRELMTKAHAEAKKIVAVVGDYLVALKITLKKAWSEMMSKNIGIGYRVIQTAKNGKEYIEFLAGDVKGFCEGEIINIAGRTIEADKRRRRRARVDAPRTAVIDGLGDVYEDFETRKEFVRVYLKDVKEA